MRVYSVQPGDTPSSIAARDDMAGCPKCAKDLVEANPHRASVRHPNGFLAFVEPLVPGENLWLPDKWFDGTLDRLPRSYFDGLPKVPMGLGELPPDEASQLASMAHRWSKLTERKPTRENHFKAASAHRAAGEAYARGRGGPIAARHYAQAREHEAEAAAFTSLGQLPPEHVPQLYEIQPGDTAEIIALKFGQLASDATQVLIQANPTLPTTPQADGRKVLCSLTAGQVLTLPDRWFAAGSTWSAIKPGCNPSLQDVTATPGAVAQITDLNHPAPKNITLSVHPAAIDAMQSASGGSRDTTATVATAAAGTGAIAGTAVVGTIAARIITDRVFDYIEHLF